MANINIVKFRNLIEKRRDELLSLSENSASSRRAVELDQQVMGRLSRQDALQQQAMAKAQDVRRSLELKCIDSALNRIANEEFGWCTECGDQIAEKRLLINLVTELCVSCAGK